jgi:hypothetical protein
VSFFNVPCILTPEYADVTQTSVFSNESTSSTTNTPPSFNSSSSLFNYTLKSLYSFYYKFKASESMNCDFENSFCGWTNDTNNLEQTWIRTSGSLSLSTTPWRPPVDTTLNNPGKYAKIIE